MRRLWSMLMSSIVLDSEPRRQHAIKVLSLIPLDPPKVVSFEDYEEKRTNAQNARLWLLHGIAAKKVGCSTLDMHEDMLCEHFGCNEVTLPSGHIKRIPLKRSSSRKVKEFAEFMTFVENFYITNLEVWLDQ